MFGDVAFSALLMTTSVIAANTAELPVKAPPPAPPSPVWSWTGCYIGGHLGGVPEQSNVADAFGMVSAGNAMRTPTFVGGGQIGANYQIGSVVRAVVVHLTERTGTWNGIAH